MSSRLFGTFPGEEKPYWHPYNFEVLSGQLVEPGLPRGGKKALMEHLINSYGKTWHTWHTNSRGQQPGMDLSYGDAKLMRSFNRGGECDEELKQDRDQAMRLDTESKRKDRQSFLDIARPQHGV